MLIGLTGYSGSGKDTLALHAIHNYEFERKAFADPNKEITGIIFGYNYEQLYGNLKDTVDPRYGVAPRYHMQKVGTELLRNALTDIFPESFNHDTFIKIMKNHLIDNKNIVITDVRFLNEAKFIKENNGIIIKIIRPSINTNDAKYIHASEIEINSIEADYTITNDSDVKSLYDKFDQIMYLESIK